MTWDGPILDNHLHLGGPGDRSMAAVDDYHNAGGTHLIVVNKPSWWYGAAVETGADFRPGYRRTIDAVAAATERLDGRAWAVLGVHPALITRLVDDRGVTVAEAGDIMREGIDEAAAHVRGGDAIGLKSGRPHYPVPDEVRAESNAVMRYAFEQAAACDCVVQLHTESGEAFSDIDDWAREAGLSGTDVVKHYADGPIEGPVPSVIARNDAIDAAAGAAAPFLMETDYLDDPDRPGAVLGPKTVPRRVTRLAAAGRTEALARAHVETPRLVYGIDTHETHEP